LEAQTAVRIMCLIITKGINLLIIPSGQRFLKPMKININVRILKPKTFLKVKVNVLFMKIVREEVISVFITADILRIAKKMNRFTDKLEITGFKHQDRI